MANDVTVKLARLVHEADVGRVPLSMDDRRLIEEAIDELNTREKALEPFAEFARNNTDEHGWAGTRCEGERINDWFGPSDFRNAMEAKTDGK